MYQKVIELVRIEGKKLQEITGTKINDAHKAKEWTTEHDEAIEAKIHELVTSFGPTHRLFSEEEHTIPEDAEDLWIADPISHTINFIRGVPHYAIVIAHIHKGEVLFGCVYDPSMDELFTAEKGKGAFLNGKQIHVRNDSPRSLILYNPYPLGDWTLKKTMEIYQKIVPLGYMDAFGSMGLQFAQVAAGRVDLVVMANKDTFPLFAGKILVEEAGGVFSDFKGKGLTVNTRGVIAGTKEMHKEALKVLL